MERRLQLVLDQGRYAQVAAEARASGRSVAAVIREAIDYRFSDAAAARRAAARELLAWAMSEADDPAGPQQTWAEMKQAMDDDLAARYP